jgi:transporter family protein
VTWIIYGLLSAFFAALVAIFAKIGLPKTDPVLATSIRAVIMAVFLVSVALVLNKFNLHAVGDKRTWIFIVLSAVAGAISWIFYFWALKLGPATAVAVIDRLSVVFVAILAALLLNETFTVKSLVGISLMVAGALFMTLK